MSDSTGSETTRRGVRSFVLRGGRTTPAQRQALDSLWPRYGLRLGARDLLHRQLPTGAAIVLEIGIGNGDALVDMASQEPDTEFVGVEVHRPGLGAALLKTQERDLENVRVIEGDACDVLRHHVATASLAGVRLFFPDPWPKKRHHKRRIVQPPFVQQVAQALRPGGVFHLATDWAPYAEHMIEVLERCGKLENAVGPGQSAPRPAWRTLTRFEKRGLNLGHEVTDLLYRRVDR
ncbi:MAG: tRNA (guanosine(46)-N7)-methyltransferase TrmB [Pseudomonadota bacterium]